MVKLCRCSRPNGMLPICAPVSNLQEEISSTVPGLLGILRLREDALEFLKKASVDPEWVENKLIQFITSQIERLNQGKIAAATIANYYKAVKLFCEMNRVRLDWKIIRRGVPTGNKAANDRAPTLEELQRLVGYPDPRIKSLVYVMVSSGIRLGAWDFLKWGHVGRRDVGPALTAIGGEMDLAIVCARPNALDVQRRRSHRINHSALRSLRGLLAAVFSHGGRNFKGLAREVRTDLLPASSTSRSLPQRVGGKVKSVRVDGREHYRLRSQHAKIL